MQLKLCKDFSPPLKFSKVMRACELIAIPDLFTFFFLVLVYLPIRRLVV